MVAVNEAELVPDAMLVDAGTMTELLVLASATARAFGAFALKVAVHVVLPAPVNDVPAQDRDFSSGPPLLVGAGESVIENDFETPSCEAVIVPVSSELTFDMDAANFTLLAPAGTFTEAGTLTAELLLERCTCIPPDDAAMLVLIVHVSAPDPETWAWSQLSPLISAEPVAPLPCSLIAAAAEDEELVITLSWPDKSDSLFGVK